MILVKKYIDFVRAYPLLMAIVHFNFGVGSGLLFALFI